MINILTMLMSVASVIPLIASTSPAVTRPSATVLQFPAVSLYAKHCYLWDQLVSRRDDYTYTPGIGGHKLHLRQVPWNEARMTCEEEGGHLAIINSIAESTVLAELFKKSPGQNYAHIGFHDLFKEGQFITNHGQSIAKAGFTQWASGEPNNARNNENCGSIHRSGGLNDITCSSRAIFICELPMPLM